MRALELENTQKAMLNVLEDLQEERRHFFEGKAKDDAMLKSIGDGLVATDKEGKIILVNPAFEKILGWHFEKVKGKKLTEIIPMLDENGTLIEEAKRPLSKTLKGCVVAKTDSVSNHYYQRKNKKTFPVSICVSPVLLNDQLIGALEIFRDITKEKEIDKLKTEFVSLASHQLRTPLTSIRLFLELLSNQPTELSESQKTYLLNIKLANDRMIQLVNDLLNVSRLEGGRIVINPTLENIESLVHEAIVEIGETASKKGVKIVFEKAKKAFPEILLDVTLFHEVLICFLSNAIRYTENKKGAINVAIQKDKNSYLIRIQDNGIGINKEDHEKIFKKFFRADNAVKKEPDGSGLGLYIAKMIIDSSGGKITFDSTPNEGTTFFIHLPLKGMIAHEGDKKIAK